MEDEYIETGGYEIECPIINKVCLEKVFESLKPELQEIIVEEYGSVDTYIASVCNYNKIDSLFEYILKDLKWNEQQVILLRYGLFDGQPKTLEEVAGIMGTTRERIRLIEDKFIRRCHRKYRPLHRSKSIKDLLNE
ncbi:MAG: hypothetical protein II919_06045 [Lachnospiraceae bacterium]|nr:hypothetical protein [Lachnospiraceae bacterium]